MKWRLINTGFNDPYMNMAIDEAIVQLMKPDDLPVLRFFDWLQPSISIGYSQRVNNVLNVSLCRKEGVPFVRRPTGGGVVFHGVDITYSLILPVPPPGWDRYFLVQSWIKKGLDKLGIKTSQYIESKKDTSGYCFISPSFGDIMVKGCKIGGLAGRRIKQKILRQGYLYFEDASNMIRFAKEIKTFKGKAMNLKSLGVDKKEVKESIINNWCGKLIEDKLSDGEEELAGNLCENKYSQDEWNLMR